MSLAETRETRALSCNRVLSCTYRSFLATDFSLTIEKRDFSIALQNLGFTIRFYVSLFQPVNPCALGVLNSLPALLFQSLCPFMLGSLHHFICISLPTGRWNLKHSVCSSLPILETTNTGTSYVSQVDIFCCIINKCMVKCMDT